MTKGLRATIYVNLFGRHIPISTLLVRASHMTCQVMNELSNVFPSLASPAIWLFHVFGRACRLVLLCWRFSLAP